MVLYNRDKISNLFVYLASEIKNLHLTKLLKLIYIIDETSIKETGVPVTWLNYKVWEKGPVAEKIYYNFSLESGSEFSDFISVVPSHLKSGLKIIPKVKFDDSEFSEYEIELLEKVVSKFGKKSSSQLIEYLHEDNTLWYKIVQEKQLAEKFKFSAVTPYEISLKEAISNELNKAIYDEMFENVQFFHSIS